MITEAIIVGIVGYGVGSFVVGFIIGFYFVHVKKLFDAIL